MTDKFEISEDYKYGFKDRRFPIFTDRLSKYKLIFVFHVISYRKTNKNKLKRAVQI